MLKSFLSLWLKFPCPLCQRITEDTICHYCQKKLRSYQITQPNASWRGNLPVFAWGKYDGDLSRAIAKIKYDGYPELGVLLGTWLGKSWLKHCPLATLQKLTVLPIPLSQEKFKNRGFNQAESMARGFCQVTKYKLDTKSLVRIKNTKAMFGLNSIERQHNIKGAFAVNPNWQKNSSSSVLLLDDIYTRGTTVTEAARILRQQKINVIGAIALAKVMKNQHKN